MSGSGTTDRSGAACGRRGPPLDVSRDDLERDVRVLSALAGGTRYELLRRLAAADGEVCVCDLEAGMAVSQSAVSHALSALHAAGLVDRRKEGRWRHYRATERAETLLDALDAARGADR